MVGMRKLVNQALCKLFWESSIIHPWRQGARGAMRKLEELSCDLKGDVKRMELGFCQYFNDLRGENLGRTAEIMKATGAKWLRTDFPRKYIYQDGKWDFSFSDELVGKCQCAGVNVYPTLYWLDRQPTPFSKFYTYTEGVVSRYKDYIGEWCLWNEPNLFTFWDNSIDRFARVLEKTGKIVKEVDKNIKAAINLSWSRGFSRPYALEFIEALHKRRALKLVDIIGVHGYIGSWDPGEPSDWVQRIYQTRATLDELGEEKEIWVDEYGFYAFDSWLGKLTYHSPDQQLAHLKEATRAIAKTRQVPVAIWYCLRDPESILTYGYPGQRFIPIEYYFGLLRKDWRPKHPDSLRTFRNLAIDVKNLYKKIREEI